MKKSLVLLLLFGVIFGVTSSVFSEDPNHGVVPYGVVGLWQFAGITDTGTDPVKGLKATLGADLTSNDSTVNPIWYLGPQTNIGTPAHASLYGDNQYAQDRNWDYMTCYHGMSANGGGIYVNEYTIAWDVRPDPGWNSLYQTSWNGNANDGDLWIDAANPAAATVGVSDIGYSTMTFDTTATSATGGWHRVVLSVDNGNFFRVYVDGTLFLDGPGQVVDGRFSLEVDWDSDSDGNLEPGRFHLFADNDWEDNWIRCGTMALWSRALTGNEISQMGGWIRTDEFYDQPTSLMILTPGDANKDGLVNELDAQSLAKHWGATEIPVLPPPLGGFDPDYDTFWELGDFNFDHVVNAADASILAANWTGGGTGEAGAVPEPATAVMLVAALGVLACLRRRRQA